MTKSPAQRAKETKSAHLQRGEKLVQVWVRADDVAAIADIRARAATSCALHGATPPPRQDDHADADLVGLNFKVTAAFRRDFRIWCATHNLSLIDGLARAFAAVRDPRD